MLKQRGRTTRSRAQAGMTLMESMTVIAVMTTILFIVAQIFIVNYDVFIKQSGRAENETGAILAARAISEMSRGASAFVSNQTINGASYVLSDQVLVLTLPSVDSSGNITGSSDYAAFFRDPLTPTKIFADIQAAPGSVRPTGKRLVTDYNIVLRFRYNHFNPVDATRVSVYLVNRQTRRNATLTTRAWTSIFLRN